jgi:hypothetical protein
LDLSSNEAQGDKPTEAQISEAIDKTLGDHRDYQRFLSDLKEAVTTDDRQAVANLMSYPLDAEIDGNSTTIDGVNVFLAFYDKIMIPEIIYTITNSSYADITVGMVGVMLGNGEVWISAICMNDTCSDSEILVSALQKGLD